MSVGTFTPSADKTDTKPTTGGCGGGSCGCAGEHEQAHTVEEFTPIGLVEDDDGIRIMPTSDDLTKPSSDAEFIKKALSEEKSNHSNLIASSRQALPKISVNGVAIPESAIAAETQYHPAKSQEDALYLAAQALVVRELLRQEVAKQQGDDAWQADEESAIAALIEQQVHAKTPDRAICQQYYDANRAQFITPPIMKVRHILLSSPPEEGEERLQLKKQASEIITTLSQSTSRDSDFIEFARRYSACPSKEDGGELGVIQKGSTVPEFEKAVFALPVGVGVNPIETRYGVHIVEVLDRQDGKQLSFDEAYPMIENRLKQQSFHHGLCDYLFELSSKADIVGIELNMNEENVYRG